MLFCCCRPGMQSVNSPHHSMGPSMSPGPYMSSPMGMSGGMSQCMGGPASVMSQGSLAGRDFFPEQGSPRSRGGGAPGGPGPMDSKSYRRSYTHAKPPYRYYQSLKKVKIKIKLLSAAVFIIDMLFYFIKELFEICYIQ